MRDYGEQNQRLTTSVMINRIRFISLLLCSQILIISCRERTELTAKNNAIARLIEKDIPKDKSDRSKSIYDPHYQWTKKRTQDLQLDLLESGHDSLQIRIWLGHSMAVKHHVVILDYKNNVWKGKLITFEEDSDKDSSGLIRHKTEKEIAPRKGWKKMFDEIRKLNIVSLKHSEELPECDGCGGSDGITYLFEIASNHQYRFYFYCNPDKISDKCREAGNVLAFANLLENEFDFNYTK